MNFINKLNWKLSNLLCSDYINKQLVSKFKDYHIYSRNKIETYNIPKCNINDFQKYYNDNWINILHLTDLERFSYSLKKTIEDRIQEVVFLNENDDRIKNNIIFFNNKPILVLYDEKGIDIDRKYYIDNTRYIHVDTLFSSHIIKY